MDIATLLESHRRYMLDHIASVVTEDDSEDAVQKAMDAVGHGHDRATTRTLLDLYRQGQPGNGQQPVGNAGAAAPVATVTSRKVKAGSKKARDRAIKAGETRRANLAAKAQAAAQGTLNQGTNSVTTTEPPLSLATHLAPRTPEGGAA